MSDATNKAVFLSYASQDADAARRICDALRQAGVEVWFDQSELRGGDAWDAKIRKQIRDCALFLPIISANTQARLEGYFRLEWKLAEDRSHLMAKGKPFIMPVCIDDTKDWDAQVPDAFMIVQWTRLPRGETSAAFCERVQTLLAGDVGARTSSAASKTERSRDGGTAVPGKRRWLLPVIVGCGVLAALAIWQPWQRSGPAAAPATSVTVVESPAKPLTEAQKLTQQARALIDEDFLAGRESFRLAEELCQRAAALDPADGEVWGTSARVSLEMMTRNYDRTEKRVALARSQAERALRLAPGSTEAGLAMATLMLKRMEATEAERSYRALLERVPQDARVALGLARALSTQRRAAEASEIRLHHPAFRERDPRPLLDEALDLRTQDLKESDALVERAQAIAPSLAGYFYQFANLVNFWGDLEQGRTVFEQLPPRLLQEDSIAGTAAWLWIRLGDGNKALRVLEQMPRDYIEEFLQEWPKGFLTGWAHHVARRPAAAQSEWKRALSVVEARLAADADKPRLIRFKALLLALTGQSDAAEGIYRLFREQSRYPDTLRIVWDAEFQLALGRPKEAIADLQRTTKRAPWELTLVRHDPSFAPIRDDPRVAAMIVNDMARMESMHHRAATPRTTAPDENRAAPAKSVAVLAFANLSDDKANEYFSDGISEELLNVLARVPGLTVRGRSSGFYFKGRQAKSAEIGEQLAVNYLVQGSVRRAGEHVRITAQLIRAATDEIVWASGSLDRDLKDIFAVQDEIAGLIAQNLQLRLAGAGGPKAVVDPEGYRLVLEGRHFTALRGETAFAQADKSFRAALAIAPSLAVAHSGLAELVALRGRYRLGEGTGRTNAFTADVLTHARRALELDPTLADAHAAMAIALMDDERLDEAQAAVDRAIALNPNHAAVLNWHSQILLARGRVELAVQQTQKASALDPLAFISRYITGAHLAYAGRYEDALVHLDRAKAIRGDIFLSIEGERVRTLLELRRTAEAVAIARALLQQPDAWWLGWWATGDALYALRVSGAGEEATRTGDALLSRIPEQCYQRGYVLCALGRFGEGLPALENAPHVVRTRLFYVPMLDQVRDTPAFQRLMEKLGCVAEHRTARETLARLRQERALKK